MLVYINFNLIYIFFFAHSILYLFLLFNLIIRFALFNKYKKLLFDFCKINNMLYMDLTPSGVVFFFFSLVIIKFLFFGVSSVVYRNDNIYIYNK